MTNIMDSNLLEEEKLYTLQLIRSENVGVKTFFSLLKFFGNAKKSISKIQDLSIKGGKSKPIKLYSKENALAEIEKCNFYGAEIISYKDDFYPRLLETISDPPPIITIFGKNKNLLQKDKVAIVGSRNASLNGTRFAYKLASDIGDNGYTVVSGLARGIDSFAHQGSLKSSTIAVIAGGIDNIYPLENTDLYKKITEQGLIISENPFGSPPKAQNFPQRNRIISGISKATIVVEAGIKSGSLITANFALDQNREVFAVPGFPMDTRYSGTNKLLKQGAYLLETVDDLITVLDSQLINNKNSLIEQKYSLQEKTLDLNILDMQKDLDKIRNLLLSLIGTSPTLIDDILRNTGVPTGIVMLAIIELELAGKIQRIKNNEITLLK